MINLLFTGNDKIFNGLSMAILSITKHCKEALNIYVLTMDLHEMNPNYRPIEQEQIDELEKYIQKINENSKMKLVDVTDIYKKENENSINKDNAYTPYAMIRLLADKVEELPDKVLYLDIDVLANGDIKELYDYDISNYEYGAVKDYYGRIFINHNYINSGVMLLNMKKIRETNLFGKCRKMINVKKMMFPDQTALNKLVQSRKFLPRKFNSQRKCKKDDVIRHFCKSIRWYPIFHSKNSLYRKYAEPMFKWLHIFHLLNIKPWHKEAMHQILKCHVYDDIMNEFERFKADISAQKER